MIYRHCDICNRVREKGRLRMAEARCYKRSDSATGRRRRMRASQYPRRIWARHAVSCLGGQPTRQAAAAGGGGVGKRGRRSCRTAVASAAQPAALPIRKRRALFFRAQMYTLPAAPSETTTPSLRTSYGHDPRASAAWAGRTSPTRPGAWQAYRALDTLAVMERRLDRRRHAPCRRGFSPAFWGCRGRSGSAGSPCRPARVCGMSSTWERSLRDCAQEQGWPAAASARRPLPAFSSRRSKNHFRKKL